MSKLDDLTAIEEATAEEAAGMPITALEDDGPKIRILGALAWVHKRRSEPELTFETFMKTHKTGDIIRYLFGDDEDADESGEVEEVGDPFPVDAGAEGERPGDAEGAVRAGDGRPAE